MKIIFDSESQKEKFLDGFCSIKGCPYDIGLDADCVNYLTCRECWTDSIKTICKVEKGDL